MSLPLKKIKTVDKPTASSGRTISSYFQHSRSSEIKCLAQGSYHQGEIKGGGTQCSCTALAFICLESAGNLDFDKSETVDYILQSGTDLYFRIIANYAGQVGLLATPRLLMVPELPESVEIHGITYTASKLEPIYTGLIGTDKSESLSLTYSLCDAIDAVFTVARSCFLILGPSSCAYTSALCRVNEQFVAFDSHCRTARGTCAQSGKAVLLQATSMAGLKVYIKELANSLFTHPDSTPFELVPVVCTTSQISHSLQSPSSFEPVLFQPVTPYMSEQLVLSKTVKSTAACRHSLQKDSTLNVSPDKTVDYEVAIKKRCIFNSNNDNIIEDLHPKQTTDNSGEISDKVLDVLTTEGDSMKTKCDSEVKVAAGSSSFPKGLTSARFKLWQKDRPWLQATADGKVYCSCCAEIKDLGLHANERVRIDKAFVDGITLSEITAKKIKKLHDKISSHAKCISHSTCLVIIATKKAHSVQEGLQQSENLWCRQNQKKIEITSRVFRTAYLCCLRYDAFTAHTEFLHLQEMNGIDVGQNLFSDHSCRNIIGYIALKMRTKMLDYILTGTDSTFSLMFDESTSVSTKTCLILYIRISYAGEVCNFFVDLIELQNQTGEEIASTVLHSLENMGFSKEILCQRLIGLCTDGASNLQGEMNGALALLKKKINTDFVVFHCMAHKLELAVHDVLKTQTQLVHFQSFVDSLYAHFSRSPKNQNQLRAVALQLHVNLLKVVRVFDIRWVASSYRSVHAIWKSYASLVEHFEYCSKDASRNGRERAKCNGICQKLKKWIFVAELAIIQDALEVLQSLSLFLQERTASVLTADVEISNTLKTLKALKNGNGVSTQEFLEEYNNDSCFHGVLCTKPTESEKSKFDVLKAAFFQCLVDNISSRFSDYGLVVQQSKVLIKDNWPPDENLRILFGDREILQLSTNLKMDQCQTSTLIRQFRMHKDGHESDAHDQLKELNQRLLILPISSAECERGFSSMNLTHTSQRNALEIKSLRDLLFVKLNGPPLEHFEPEQFVRMWLKDGHHSAVDRPSGRTAPTSSMQSRHKLFI